MVPRPSNLGALTALLLGFGLAPVLAAEPAAPVNLTAAVARTAAEPGWRVEQLADGRLATIGVNPASDVTHVIGIACGASHRPEVAVDARGAVAMPRAFVLEIGNQLAAIPIAPAGASAEGADALLNALAVTPDGDLKLALDDRAFPVAGAREALEPVWKQCEQLFGWRITDPDPLQLFWSYVPDKPAEPTLVFRGPKADVFVAAITCDPNRGSLTVNVVDLVKAGKKPQPVRFTVEASGESFVIAGQSDPAAAGGPNQVTGTLADPNALLTALGDSARLSFRSKTGQVTVPTQGLRLLLPRFRHACALP